MSAGAWSLLMLLNSLSEMSISFPVRTAAWGAVVSGVVF
jgi:hypothetical protein